MDVPHTPSPNRAPPRVLVWLQDSVEADLLALQLRQAGLVVVAARSAEHVRNALSWAPADVFIVEVPHSRTAETLAFLKAQQSPATALYAVTAAGSLERTTELSLLSLGCRDIWSLPLSPVAISQQVWTPPAGSPPAPPTGLDPYGIPGDFRFQPLTFVMQICRRHRLHARLHARLGDGASDDWGVLLMRHGEIIDAEVPGARGKVAAVQWLARASKLFVLHPLADTSPELTRPDVIREDIARLLMRARQQTGEVPAARPVPKPIADTEAPAVADAPTILGVETGAPATNRVPTAEHPKTPTSNANQRPTNDQRPRSAGVRVTAAPESEAQVDTNRHQRTDTAEGIPTPRSSRHPPVPHIKRIRDDMFGEDAHPEDTADGRPSASILGSRRSIAPLVSAPASTLISKDSATPGPAAPPAATIPPTDAPETDAPESEFNDPAPTWYPAETDIAPVVETSAAPRAPAEQDWNDAKRRGAPAVPPMRVAASETTAERLAAPDDARPTADGDRPPVQINPKSGLIHISTVKLKTAGSPPPDATPAGASVRVRGMGRIEGQSSAQVAAMPDEPRPAGLSSVRVQAVEMSDEDPLGTQERRAQRPLLALVGWLLLIASLVGFAILALSRSPADTSPPAETRIPIVQEAREKAAAGDFAAVIVLLAPHHAKGKLKSLEMKLLALAHRETGDLDAAATVLADLLKLSPSDTGATAWMAVFRLLADDADGWRRLVERADFLAPSDPGVRKLRDLGP